MASFISIIKQLQPINSRTKIDLLIDILKERDTVIDFSLERKIHSSLSNPGLINYYREKKKSLKHNENISSQIASALIAFYEPINSIQKVNEIVEILKKYGYELTLKDKELIQNHITEDKAISHWISISKYLNKEISEGYFPLERIKKSKEDKEKKDKPQKTISKQYTPKILFIKNKTNVDLIVNYFKFHKEELTPLIECWIQYNLIDNKLSKYYNLSMPSVYPGYKKILGQAKNIKLSNLSEKNQKKIETFSKKLQTFLEKYKEDNNSLPEKKKKSSFDILQKKECVLDWNYVLFQQGSLVIYGHPDNKIKFKPKTIYVKGAIKSFNYLKKYLNERLPPIRCSVDGLNITILDEINFNSAIMQFSQATKQGVIKSNGGGGVRFAPMAVSFSQAMSKARQMPPEEFKKYKSNYIDFLVTQQSERFKVIPCVERLAHTDSDTTEYAFIFSIECNSGDILIVHENVNPDRSTLLFVVKNENYERAIRAIYDFMQSAEVNKRSSLRDRDIKIEQASIERYRSINHDYLSSWKMVISSYKQRYSNGYVYIY